VASVGLLREALDLASRWLPRPIYWIACPEGRSPDLILAIHAQATQRHARQEAASAIGQRSGPAISASWWKSSTAGSFGMPMTLFSLVCGARLPASEPDHAHQIWPLR
jgi:hypothetical protein